jgi:ferric-dicitrate binding protein FerR (iron transport regulator)
MMLMSSRSLAVVVALAAVPCFLGAQDAKVNVQFESAPVIRVAAAFSRFSGRTISVAPDATDRALSGEVANAGWADALDRLLEPQALIARPDSGGSLRIERESPITLDFENAPLSRVVREIAKFTKRSIALAPDIGDPTVTFATRSQDWQRALDAMLNDVGCVATADADGNFRITRR